MRWKKFLFWFLIFTLMFVTVMGDGCKDVIQPNNTCEMVTPPLSCSSYDYVILNETDVVENGNLSAYNESLYYFNFSKDVGRYYIVLCDGSFKEVSVKFDEVLGNMAWLGIIAGLGLFSGLFIYISRIINDPLLKASKIMFFFLGVVNVFFIGITLWIMSNNPYDSSSFGFMGLAYMSISLVGIIIFVWNYAYTRIGKMFKKEYNKIGGR